MNARTHRAACPQCNRGSRDKAMSVTTDERGTVCYCHRCGYAAAENIKRLGAPPSPRSYRPWQELAAYLWSQSLPIRGTSTEVYLRHRGCQLPPEDSDIRYLPGRGRHPHAMLARVTDALTAEPISLHFTRLAADGSGKAGTDCDKLLLAGHRKLGGVIRLWPDEAVTQGLAVAEGIESALCAGHAFAPVWAAIDAGNLASLPVLHGIRSLLIVADHDPAGIAAAQDCAKRWHTAGREVRVALAMTPGQDAADVVAA